MAEFTKLNGYDVKDKKAIRYYLNVNDMISDLTLREGMCVFTEGYYSSNDGGAAKYIIVDTQDNNKYQELLNNELYAELVSGDFLNVKQCGLYGDDTHDDTSRLIQLLPFERLYFPKGTYKITDVIDCNNRIYFKSDIKSNYDKLATLKLYGTDTTININSQKSVIDGICINTDNSDENNTSNVGIHIKQPFTRLYNSNVYNFADRGVEFSANCWLCEFNNCRIEHNNIGVRTNNNCNFAKFINCYIHANATGVYVYGTTQDGGSPMVLFDKCDIEDNTSRGINISGSNSNEVFINNCYFEHHQGFAIYGVNVSSTPTKGSRSIHINNSRFYAGNGVSNLIYLYWYDNAYINNCNIDVNGNDNTFDLINIGANTPYVNITNTQFNIKNSPNVTAFNQPTKVSCNDIRFSDAIDSSEMPSPVGAGAICYVGTHKNITDLKIYDGTYWRNNDGTVY